MAQQNLNKVFGQVADVEVITATTTLTLNDTGKTFIIDQGAAAITITLPTDRTSDMVGWNARFILRTAAAENATISIGSAALLLGNVASHGQDALTGVVVTVGGSGTVLFKGGATANDAVGGDRVDIVCHSVQDILGTTTAGFLASAQANS